jgi:hypothetical protein
MPPRDYLLLLGVAAGALSMLVSNPVGVSFTGTVALFATVVTARAQETEERYGRTRMGPSVLTIEQETEKASKPGSEFTECASGCPAMIVVPAGSFRMGSPATEADRSPNEGPQHEVTIAKPFAVGRTEVTFAQWDACVAAGACRKVGDNAWGRGDRPVINAGWSDAVLYVEWLARMTGKPYRLLSEAEWEYAARAAQRRGFRSATTTPSSTAMPGTSRTPIGKRRRSVPRRPTGSASTTCTGMSTNGSPIPGTRTMRTLHRTAPFGATTRCRTAMLPAAVPGISTRRICGRRAALVPLPISRMAMSGCASRELC